jgi:hypothetical protein
MGDSYYTYDTCGIIDSNIIKTNDTLNSCSGNFLSQNTPTGTGLIEVSGATEIKSGFATNVADTVSYYASLTPEREITSDNISGTVIASEVLLFNPSSGTATLGGTGTSQITFNGGGLKIIQVTGNLVFDPSGESIVMNFTNGAQPSMNVWFVTGDITCGSAVYPILPTILAGTFFYAGTATLGDGDLSAGGMIAYSTGSIVANNNRFICQQYQYLLDQATPDYALLQSSLDDAQAVQINALSSVGGVITRSGSGGVTTLSQGNVVVTSTNQQTHKVLGSGNFKVQVNEGSFIFDGQGTNSNLVLRSGSAGAQIKTQNPAVQYTDSASVSVANLFVGLLQVTSATAVTLTFETATNIYDAIVAAAGSFSENDSVEFSIVNTSTLLGEVTVAPGSGGTYVGQTVPISKSSRFVLTMASSSAYIIYQLN